ncbi:MAG: phosphatase PAP2 family protein [bacterium]|nr:phosphatase PAP2 family protein [bacterium]
MALKLNKNWAIIIRIAVASFVFLVLGLIASASRLNFVDKAAVELIYGLPSQLEPVLDTITQIGSIGAFVVVSVVLLALKRYQTARKLIPSGILAIVISLIAKEFYRTDRPFVVLNDIVERVGSSDTFGFPSGHVAIISAIAFSLMGMASKNLRIVLWVLIILVATSRLYLGVHTLTDVVGGFMLGYIAAESVQFVINITDRHKRKK